MRLTNQLAVQHASETEDAGTKENDAAGLWGLRTAIARDTAAAAAAAGDREGFPAESAVASNSCYKDAAVVPEVANCRSSGTAVRDVPRLRTIAGSVGGIADGKPVRVAGCQKKDARKESRNIVNAITEAVGKEQKTVTSTLRNGALPSSLPNADVPSS